MKKTLLALMILVIIGIAAAQFEDFTNDLRNEKIEEPAKKAPDPLAEMLNNEITEKLNEASKQDIASNEINDIFERKLNDQLTEKQDKTSTTVKEQNTTSKQTPKTELKETSPLQDKLNQLIDTELTNEPSNQENKEIEAGKINKPIQNQPDETIYDALDEKIKKLGDEAEITIDGISLEKIKQTKIKDNFEIEITDHPIKKIKLNKATNPKKFKLRINKPEITNAVQTFAIDPTQLEFSDGEITVKAQGTWLYKCPTWNYDTQTCERVQSCDNPKNECTTTGGWTKIMQITPGEEYTIIINATDPAYAEYNATIGAPICPTGESPCIASSTLLRSRDSLATPEPNQPNTVDTCTDGTSGVYLTDESIENITITSLNGTYFRQGDTINVTATFACYNTADDNLNWVYKNNSNSSTTGWTVKAFTDPCPTALPSLYTETKTFTIDNINGTHTVRVINEYNGATTNTCGAGAYDDNDDLAFRVYTRIPPQVNITAPVANTTKNINDTVTINATVTDDDATISTVQANITLPNGTTTLVNLSRVKIGEIQENITINGSWRTINFANTYVDPVVFASPLAERGARPAEIRITNITKTSFQIRAQEPTGLYPEADNHPDEWPTSIFVIETGINTLANGQTIEVRKTTSTTTMWSGGGTWTTYTYNWTWATAPIVLSQIQTNNDPRFVTTAKRNVGTTTFEMSMEISRDNNTAHGNETIAWMAINATGSGSRSTIDGINYSSVTTGSVIRGHDNGCYATAHGLGQIPKAVIGMLTTRAQTIGGWARYCSDNNIWTTTNTYWEIELPDSGNRRHNTNEAAGYIAFNQSGNILHPTRWTGTYNGTQTRGQYNITIIATDLPGNVNNTETTYFRIPTYPNVTLISPANDSITNNTANAFICNATDDFGVVNITFNLWNSTGGLIQSNTTTVTGTTNTSNITTTLVQGTYYWGCSAYTVYNLTNSSANWTLLIDTTPPNVTNVTPIPDTQYETQDNVTITANVTDNIQVANATVEIKQPDGTALVYNMTQNNTIWIYIFNETTQQGTYNVTIIANDTAGNVNNTQKTNFTTKYRTTLFLNETKDPVENGEYFYYYADYEYAINGSDVLNATCTIEALNATDVRWHNGLDNTEQQLNNTLYTATTLENLPANYIGKEYVLQTYLTKNGTQNKNINIWVTNNPTNWNSTQTPNLTINTTTNPEINTTIQLINTTLNTSLFPTSANYTIILNCQDCNTTDYYSLGKDTDNFGHSYHSEGTEITWNNMTLDSFENMIGILLTTRTFPMTYNATESRYQIRAIQYLYAESIFTYTWRGNCTKENHTFQTNTTTLTVANNYPPHPNITSITPNPAMYNIDDVTVNWTTDASGKAFGITTSYVNLTYPNGTFAGQYQGSPFVINKINLTVIGNYTLTAFAQNNYGSNTSNATLQVIYPAPSVTILTPKGETTPNYQTVTIAAEIYSMNGVGNTTAQVTKPNGSMTNITLQTAIQNDTFQNATQWQNYTWYISPGQECTQTINNEMNIFINGTGNITLTKCGYYGIKTTYGNFNTTIDFNISTINPGVVLMFKLIENYTQNTGNGVGISYQYLADQRTIAAQQESAGNITMLNQTATTLDYGTLGISRTNNTFTLYFINSSGTQNVATTEINTSKGLYLQIYAQSISPDFYGRNITLTNFTIESNTTNIYTANYFDPRTNGTYNATIYANNTYGAMNDSEKTNFTIEYVNTPPSAPVILSPIQGEIIYGIYPITWEPITDFQIDTVLINITLLHPNETFYQNITTELNATDTFYYFWNTSTALNGYYKIKITAYENDTTEHLSSSSTTGTFTIDQEAPSVQIIYPTTGAIKDNTKHVTIAINITDPDGLNSTYANVTLPNGTITAVNLSTGQQSDDFDTNTMNTSWTVDYSEVAPEQTCTADINSTIPGKAFIQLTGTPTTSYFTECSIASTKQIAGDFDINVSFDLLGKLNGPSSGISLYISDELPTAASTRKVIITYANYTPDENAYYAYSQLNGTGQYTEVYPIDDQTGKLRIKRTNNTFQTYFWNNTAGNWKEIELPINISDNMEKSVYAALQVESSYPEFSTVNTSFDNLSIWSNNYTFGTIQSTNPLGRHNVTIIATDNYGRTNDTETTWYNTTQINDPPTYPEILAPRPDATIGGQYNIAWIESIDEDGDTILYNITLLNPDLSHNATIATQLYNATNYIWNTTQHADGTYSMEITAYENETTEHYATTARLEGDGNFTIINTRPNVTIIAPQGETYDQNKIVVISVNATAPSGIKNATAAIDTPNGTQQNITLEKGLQSDNFDNSSEMNITWIKVSDVAGSQVCTADINTTIPGKGFANISGNGFPNTASICGVGSSKRIDGDFDINFTFYWNAPKQGLGAGIILRLTEENTALSTNRQVAIYYGNISQAGTAIRVYANDNNTFQAISQVPIYLTNGTGRIKRAGNNFTIYILNASSGSWIPIPTSKQTLNLSRALHVQMGVSSSYPHYSDAAGSIDNLNIISDNLTFGLFNHTSQLGLYNASITATDNFGGINNSEKTNFTIAYNNDPPSSPIILKPEPGEVWSLFDRIAWLQVYDEENHTVKFNITLLNPDYTYNQTITSNHGNISTSQYDWDTETAPDGIYSITVKVFENETTEKLSQSNTLIGNFTINNKGPDVYDLIPLNGSTFTSNTTVTIGANVTDLVGVDTVKVNVTLPDNSNQIIYLNNTQNNWYETNFTNTALDGTYKAHFYANDTYGKINNTEITFFVIPNDPPNITINSPANNTNYTQNIFNITINATVTDPNNNTLCVKIHASNETPITNESYHLLARIGACYNQSTETITYNWTSPVIQPDQNTIMLLHFDYDTDIGENETHIYDFSGNNNNASCTYNTSCPTYASGKIGAAMEYYPGEYLTVQDSPTLDGMNEITIETWIKANDISEFQIIDKNQSYEIYLDSSGRASFALFNPNATVTSTSTITTGNWHLIQATYNGNEMTIYLDGVPENTTNRTGPVDNTTEPLIIGVDAEDLQANPFDGIIDQVAVHNKSLDWQTIRNHYRLKPGTWYWHVHASDFKNTTTSETRQININPSITLTKIKPDDSYYINETAEFTYNATAALGISQVNCQATLPNDTTTQLQLNGTPYTANYTDLILRGTYNYTCSANDTINDETTTSTGNFTRIAPDNKIADLVNQNMQYHNYTTTIIANASGILTLNFSINSTRVPNIILYNHSETSYNSMIMLATNTNENNESFADSWAIDLTGINMTTANITAYTEGNHLHKCTNFTWDNLTCADEFDYAYVKEVQNGTNYTIELNSTDPIFTTTIIGNDSINDTSLRQNQPNTPQGTLASMRIGRAGGANANFKPTIKFNLTGLPQGAAITNATLGLYFYNIPAGDDTGNRTYNIHKTQQNPARNWQEYEATWNNYTTTNAWTTPGGDYIAAITDSISFNSSSLNSYVYWDVTSDMQNLSDDRTQNFGWILMDSTSTGNTRRDFRSKEAITATQRPVLIIEYAVYTAFRGAKTNFTEFNFSSATYIPVFTIIFNTTQPQTNISALCSLNLEKLTGTAIDTISARTYLDGALIATDPSITTALVNEPEITGIAPILTNVSNGTHNITVEFSRVGDGTIEISNIDYNILEFTTPENHTVRTQLTPANYQHTTGGTTYPYAFNWTINRTCPGDGYVTGKGTHSSTGIQTAISYKFIDRDTLEESPTWEAVTLNSTDLHSMSGNWIFENQAVGENNMSVGSRNYQAGRTTTVNMTILDFDMNDCANESIQSAKYTNPLANWSTAITVNDTWTMIGEINFTPINGTSIFVSFTSTPQLIGTDTAALNVTQKVQATGTGVNCSSTKEIGLFGQLDAGNLYIYTICENLTIGQNYTIQSMAKAQTGRQFNQYDEALTVFELDPLPIQQIIEETRPDLEAVNITFNNNPNEEENTTITATINNTGAPASNVPVIFVDGICGNGTQINGNQTITSINTSQTVNVNVTWNATPPGPHNISVCIDPDNLIDETDKTNNNLTGTLNVQANQINYGWLTGNLTLDTSQNETVYDWNLTTGNKGYVYFTNSNATINFTKLYPLGRNISGENTTNDFLDADINLGMTTFNDSIQVYWAVNASTPKQTMTFTVFGKDITGIPVINSTNTNHFVTGILWDATKDTDGQYSTTDKEDLIFVGNININQTGAYGTYDYEVKVPVLIRTYNYNTSMLKFYTELR